MIATGSFDGRFYNVNTMGHSGIPTNMKVCGIYAISGVFRVVGQQERCLYVGSSVNVKERTKDHLHHLNNKTHINPVFQNVWNKEKGSDSFSCILLEICSPDVKIDREQNCIDYFSDCYGFECLINISDKACHPPVTEEKREGARTRGKERWTGSGNPKYGSDMKGQNNPFYGKRHSEEFKKNLSEACKERFRREGGTWQGRKHSEESKRKISQSKKGKSQSLETKIKLSVINKGGTIPSLYKAVAQLDAKTGSIICLYSSITQASKDTRTDMSSISRVCRAASLKGSISRTAGGYKWAFVDAEGNLVDPVSFNSNIDSIKA